MREKRRNDKYAQLGTIIKFLCSFFFFPVLSAANEVVLEGCLGSNMSFVFVWECECDRRAESDEGQRTEGSQPDIGAIFVCRNSEVVLLPWRQLVFSI